MLEFTLAIGGLSVCHRMVLTQISRRSCSSHHKELVFKTKFPALSPLLRASTETGDKYSEKHRFSTNKLLYLVKTIKNMHIVTMDA